MGIYEVPLPAHTNLKPHPQMLLLATVQPCNATLDKESGLYTYTGCKPVEVIDVNAIQAVVGRTFTQGQWYIIDRSGDLAQATFTGQED
jgi:hypothetical protein